MVTFNLTDTLTTLLYVFLILDTGSTLLSSWTTSDQKSASSLSMFFTVTSIIPFMVYGLFIAWFFRVYRNLQALGVKGLKYSTKRAIISFLIPGLNLFEPTKAIKELWMASESVGNIADGYSWKKVVVPGGIGVWWFLAVVTRFHEVQFFGRGTEDITQFWDIAVTPIAVLIVNLLTIIIVRRIDSRQAKKKASIGSTIIGMDTIGILILFVSVIILSGWSLSTLFEIISRVNVN
jgi:heme/copper-type cytochrome/quinol oxidase subunit 2